MHFFFPEAIDLGAQVQIYKTKTKKNHPTPLKVLDRVVPGPESTSRPYGLLPPHPPPRALAAAQGQL